MQLGVSASPGRLLADPAWFLSSVSSWSCAWLYYWFPPKSNGEWAGSALFSWPGTSCSWKSCEKTSGRVGHTCPDGGALRSFDAVVHLLPCWNFPSPASELPYEPPSSPQHTLFPRPLPNPHTPQPSHCLSPFPLHSQYVGFSQLLSLYFFSLLTFLTKTLFLFCSLNSGSFLSPVSHGCLSSFVSPRLAPGVKPWLIHAGVLNSLSLCTRSWPKPLSHQESLKCPGPRSAGGTRTVSPDTISSSSRLIIQPHSPSLCPLADCSRAIVARIQFLSLTKLPFSEVMEPLLLSIEFHKALS